MNSQLPDSENFLYSGGLAETVSRPSPLTYSFLAHWFRGSTSVGKAMQLIGLPYEAVDVPLVKVVNKELYVDLRAEEKTLYSKTLFKYKPQTEVHSLPSLKISYARLFSLRCIINTFKIVGSQSQLISSPEKILEKAKMLVGIMPQKTKGHSFEEIDSIITEQIWPSVIAIGALCEFYSRLIEQEAKNDQLRHEIMNYIGSQLRTNDWFFTSLSHQEKVRDGKMSFDEYLEHYGVRGTKDYELDSPRWHEVRELIYEQIQKGQSLAVVETELVKLPKTAGKLKSYINTSIKLQILRSETRRVTLVWIDALRQEIIKKTGSKEIGEYLREELIKGSYHKKEADSYPAKLNEVKTKRVDIDHAKGMAVSLGIVRGKVQHISSGFDHIKKDSIGIFPNASTDFTMLYPKCTGMIFLVGGQTSHGAIVAREFKIPALVEGTAKDIQEGTLIEIDGREGSWKIIQYM